MTNELISDFSESVELVTGLFTGEIELDENYNLEEVYRLITLFGEHIAPEKQHNANGFYHIYQEVMGKFEEYEWEQSIKEDEKKPLGMSNAEFDIFGAQGFSNWANS